MSPEVFLPHLTASLLSESELGAGLPSVYTSLGFFLGLERWQGLNVFWAVREGGTGHGWKLEQKLFVLWEHKRLIWGADGPQWSGVCMRNTHGWWRQPGLPWKCCEDILGDDGPSWMKLLEGCSVVVWFVPW